MSERYPFSREIHLEPVQWERVSMSVYLSHKGNENEEDGKQLIDFRSEIMPLLLEIISTELTSRQQAVLNLWILEGRTQVSAARVLGIQQPTVNQHLWGKIRGGKRIGGAFPRIRKRIHKRALLQEHGGRRARVLLILDALLDQMLSRRKACRMLQGLS
jgi:predicted transcriptional regulator